MKTLFSEEERCALREAKIPLRHLRKKRKRTAEEEWGVYKVPAGWAEKWAPKIMEPLSNKIADMIVDVAAQKQINHYNLSYYQAKKLFTQVAEPALVKLLKTGDVSDILDFQGRSGEFDREVVLPGLKAIFHSLGAKFQGFGPLSIQMRLAKETRSLPGERELYQAADELRGK